MLLLKQKLYDLCCGYLLSREASIKKIIAEARIAATEDTKSSAGDKFETGREMIQQEINLNLERLNELNKQKLILDAIHTNQVCATVVPGALVHTSQGAYYIGISAGPFIIDGQTFYSISLASPLGGHLGIHAKGDTFLFRDKSFTIKEVG